MVLPYSIFDINSNVKYDLTPTAISIYLIYFLIEGISRLLVHENSLKNNFCLVAGGTNGESSTNLLIAKTIL